MKDGKQTSEHKQSQIVVILSVALPIIAMICDVLINQSIATGTGAMIAGLISSAIAAAGYSHSRGKVKAAETIAGIAIKKPEA